MRLWLLSACLLLLASIRSSDAVNAGPFNPVFGIVGNRPAADAAPLIPVSTTIRNRMVLPHRKATCSVDRIELKAAGGGGAPAQSAGPPAQSAAAFVQVGSHSARQAPGGSAAALGPIDTGTPLGLLRHLTRYTGVEDIIQAGGGINATLTFPENMAFRRVSQHYWSCVDPRARYAILGTLGGDIGEWINAISAMERLQNRPYFREEVNELFQSYLRIMVSRGRRYFYMHTDEPSQAALKAAARVSNPLQPSTPAERNRLLDEAIKPQHVGCQHLKGMLTNPQGYGVRKDMVEWIIQSYLNVYFDPHNPLRTVLLYVVNPGAPIKAKGHARIFSPDACPGVAPLFQPNSGASSLVVHHEAHTGFFRQDLARYFAFQNSDVDLRTLHNAIEQLATLQATTMMGAYREGATVTDAVFTSSWDKWPF